MKNLLALLILVAMAPVAEAGPLRDRLRARFAPRPAVVTLPAGVIRPTAPVPYSAAPAASPNVVRLTLPATCATGQCPLIRR